MKKRDILLIFSLLIVAFVLLIPTISRKGGKEAYIYVGGDLLGRYDLDRPCSFPVQGLGGITDEIEIKDGSIYVKSATCPGRQCMACGHISRSGESICCAPAGILIIIRGEDGQYDAITK